MTYSPWEQNFIGQLVSLREKAGMTQTDVAKLLKDRGLAFHQQTIARIEAGTRPVRLDEAFIIADVFGVELSTMTNPARTPTLRNLAFAADRAQRRLSDVFYGTQETLNEYMEYFEQLSLEIRERLESNLVEKRQLDDVTEAALHYMFELNEIVGVLLDAHAKTGGLLGLSEEEVYFYAGAHEEVQTWVDIWIPKMGRGPDYSVDTYNDLIKLLSEKGAD